MLIDEYKTDGEMALEHIMSIQQRDQVEIGSERGRCGSRVVVGILCSFLSTKV